MTIRQTSANAVEFRQDYVEGFVRGKLFKKDKLMPEGLFPCITNPNCRAGVYAGADLKAGQQLKDVVKEPVGFWKSLLEKDEDYLPGN